MATLTEQVEAVVIMAVLLVIHTYAVQVEEQEAQATLEAVSPLVLL